ncbi:MAG: MFS transporter [Myxococcales bacterium]|nr:MFS transporter [Myxococcales bacterium]
MRDDAGGRMRDTVDQSVRGEARAVSTQPLLLHPSIRKARVLLSLAVLLVANLLPLLGVALWGWKLFDLIVIYWLETLVIGGFGIMQMALTAGWFALFVVPFFIVHFGGFMAGCLVLAFGTAIFKPGIQGTLAQSMSKKNSSVGWGFFYWLVNVGAMIGPFYAAFMRGKGWPFVFFGSALVISFNLPMLLTYKEVDSGADKGKPIGRVVIDTVRNFFGSPKLMLVVVLFSGFWMMLYQLWDLMPNFYTDWVDSLAFVKNNSWIPSNWVNATDIRGPSLKQEIALNLNSFLIVAFVIPMSFLVARIRVMTSITIGVLIATIGTVIYGTSPSLYICALGIVFFSVGEMLTGPKKTEYFALIAPAGKKALYLGYVNIPVAVGQSVGAKIAAWQYGTYGEKATLSLRYLVEKTGFAAGRAWDGDVSTLEAVTGVERKAAFATLVKELGQDPSAVNELLWTTYRPYQVWYPFAIIGLCSLVGIIVFSQVSKRWKDMDV